jgi:hypothetical protein
MEAFEIIRTTMKEFDEVEDDTINVYISLAEPLISERKFGKLYQQALAYLAAHRMKMLGLGTETVIGGTLGSTYGIASVSEGGVSVSFNNSQTDVSADSEYSMTVYGKQYLTLRNRVIVPITINGGGSCG